MDLYLVQRGNETWYCPRDQVEMWAGQGCAVFELTPSQIAGPAQDATDDTDGARPSGEGSTRDSAGIIESFDSRRV